MLNYTHGKKTALRSLDDDWNPFGNVESPFTEEHFLELLVNAETVSCWDFNTALGDTCREKYESLVYKIFEVSKVIAAKIPQPEFFWAAMHPILGGGIAMGLANTDKPQYIPMGGKDPVFIGTLMDRVKFYECPILPENQMLIGCSDEVKPSHFYGRINIANFVV